MVETKMKQHGLYKFVTRDTGEIIYIGKSNNNIKSRIDAHIRGKGIDEKFNAYRNNYKVYISFMPNTVETDIMERALINKYKPILNKCDNYQGTSELIQVKEPQWVEYIRLSDISSTQSKKFKKEEVNPFSETIFIGKLFGVNWYINKNIAIRGIGKTVYEPFIKDTEEGLRYIKNAVYLCEKYGTYNEESHRYEVNAELIPKDMPYYLYLWNKGSRGPGLIANDKNITYESSIIVGMAGTGDILEIVSFSKESLDICKQIISNVRGE